MDQDTGGISAEPSIDSILGKSQQSLVTFVISQFPDIAMRIVGSR